jgi:ubiquinone/menaquinone biosynthesis C-methylase UbiE
MPAPTAPEVDRLRKTYQSYREEGIDRRWSSENPGNREMLRERQAALHEALDVCGLLPLAGRTILDVGCGSGGELAHLQNWGAEASHLQGVDLLPERVAAAMKAHPELTFSCGNAESLNYPDGTFDLVLLFTVLSSILDPVMTNHLCAELGRVLKPGGAVLYYDFRFRNPYNPQVRGLKKRELSRLFPGYGMRLRSLTLLPPLARRLGRWTANLYPVLAGVSVLRTHLLGLLIKPHPKGPSPRVEEEIR